MSQPFTMTRTVRFSETDMAGVMHFSNYLRWMEDVEHAFWRSLGLSVHDAIPGQATISWPRVSVKCDYAAPLRFEDEVELRLRVEGVGEKSITFAIEFHRAGRRAAHGTTTAVCCRVESGRFQAIPIPPEILAKLA